MQPTHPRTNWATEIIRGVRTFAELEGRIAALSLEKDRGDAFEVFVEAYLATQPIAQAETVWAANTAPIAIRQQLNLPSSDFGADGVYRDRNGNLVVYQAKFRTDRTSLSWRELSTFFGIAEKADQRILLTNSDAIASVAEQRSNFHSFRGADFERLEASDFDRMAEWLVSGIVKPIKRKPRCHQVEALRNIENGLRDNDRATVVMACGTGKTLISLWAAEQVSPKRVLVLVPSLALLRQTLHEWAHFTRWGDQFRFLCVCSDPSVSRGIDELMIRPEDIDFPVSTDAREVERFLAQKSESVRVIFSTYQSAHVVAEGMEGSDAFDIGIFDEAHKTAGREGSKFSFALSDENLPICKRVFFTATPRHYDIRKKDKEGDAKLVFSMNNEAVYGPVVHKLAFAEAAERAIICNYKVVISVVDGQMVNNDLLKRGEVLVKDDYVRARQVAVQLALQWAVEEFGVGRIITFHNSVKAAAHFVAEGAEGVHNHLPGFSTFHVNGTQRTADREDYLRAFAEAEKGLITNARCLTEGVDVPAVDMVAFVSPRRSKIDIVQATGRAMRKAGPEKDFGYVLMPIFLEQEEGETLEDALERSKFAEIADVLNAMQEQDAELAEIIQQLKQEKGRVGGYDVSRLADKLVTLGPEVGLAELRRAVSAMLVNRLGPSWDEHYGALVAFREREGHCWVPQRFQAQGGFKLGVWAGEQRRARDTMSAERKALLDSLSFVWDAYDAAWNEGYEHLKAFQEREGHCRVPDGFRDESGFKLGNWVSVQRQTRDTMSAERKALLDKLDFVWRVTDALWNEGYEHLKVFQEREGHCRVPYGFQAESGFKLGSWVSVQRRTRDALSAERKALLDELGFVWDPLDAAWTEGYEHLKAFQEREGHCRVRRFFRAEGGFKLGVWVTSQRSNRDTMSAERKALLDELDFIWDVADAYWNEGYEHLKAFWEREGHCRVPYGFQAESGFKLGSWVSVQRKTRDALSAERKALLDELGFVWDPLDAAWTEGYEHLKAFWKREGHCRVPRRFQAESGFKLGSWVGTQRRTRNALSAERKALLDELGFVWDPLDAAWTEGYEHLKAFWEREGHCWVPTGFQAESGFKLGSWVGTQRRTRNALSAERRAWLDALGFEWSLAEKRTKAIP